MILYLDDWRKFPSAIPDMRTTNRSFLELASLYRSMGVKNYYFHLALHTPELSGVDAHSPTLTLEQKAMIRDEAELNYWYYLREIARIAPNASTEKIQFKANRANISLFWSFLNHIDYLLIQPRQTGKSVSTDTLSNWLLLFRSVNTGMILITKDDDLRARNIARMKKMRFLLPEWLVVNDKNDANNSYMLTYNTRRNNYTSVVGQNDEERANKVGRGATVPFLHIDEGPFINYADVMLPAALASASAARAEAERNGMEFGNIFTTTAGKIDSRSGGYFYNKLYSRGMAFDEKFYDLKDRAELVSVLENNRKSVTDPILFVGVWNHRQLGYTDQWLLEEMAKVGAEGEAADRDWMNKWTSGGINNPLPIPVLEAIKASEIGAVNTDIGKGGYVSKWYIDEVAMQRKVSQNQKVIIGVDTSDAVGQDAISITLTDAADLGVIARADINRTNLLPAARWVVNMLVRWSNTVLIIEKKSSAQTFIDMALEILPLHGIDPFKRIFNRLVDQKGQRAKAYEEVHSTPVYKRTSEWYDQYKELFGFNTTGDSRRQLYSSVLVNAARRSSSVIRDRTLSEQIRQLTVRNGRVDHPAGGHDDAVMSWLLCHWLLMYGKNLDYYGIDTSKIQLRVGADGGVATQEEIWERHKQQLIKNRIEVLVAELKTTSSINQVMMLEQQLRVLSSKLMEAGDESFTVDSIINEAKAMRARNKRDKKYARAA